MPSLFTLFPQRRKALIWSLTALGLVVLLSLTAWSLVTSFEDRVQASRHQAERELLVIGHLQTQSITAWREQRMADGWSLLDDSLFASAVANWLKDASPEHVQTIQQRLRILQERAKYEAVYLVNAQGQVQLSAMGSSTQKLPEPEQQALDKAITQAVVAVVEPRTDPVFAFPFFSVLVPVFDGANAIGAVWLVSDVRNSLYPLLNQWPTPSATAESAIIMRQGSELVYLSPLRHAAQAGLKVRSLLSRTTDPAVQAILGARGIFYAQDYRAQAVLAMASAVPDSPWLVISKIDESEIMANTRSREIYALGLPVLLGLLFVGAVFALWQRKAWWREHDLKTELQRNMHWLESAQKAATIGYFSYGVKQQTFALSTMAGAIFGLTDHGPVPLAQWVTLLHPEDRQHTLDQHRQAVEHMKPLRTQYRIQRAQDQQLRWIEVWCEFELSEQKNRGHYMIGTVQDITERKQTEEELARYRVALEEKIRLDPLTQIANRRALDEQLALEWQRAMRRQTPLAFLMIDVDYFKLYNDHYGHVAGDECLKNIAQAIAASVNRAGELAARYGGEEFAVLLPEADVVRAMQTAERICQAIRTLNMAHNSSGVAPHVTVSVGVASVQPIFVEAVAGIPAETKQPPTTGSLSSLAPSIQRMINQADEALYQAKQQGRNRALPYGTVNA
ncbi:MAG: sensor domain-containing diguanylate cyclase [Comamonadaceae bacterium CG17_big_fil_post_rev_8_21_14_2_50_60_13]|nr:MAG: sensor domain-containing diguanylate cyclase [Comamonadaceae bacterium CG17_big_fil_post_rev_8_21_14_2_50_60_13]